MFYVITETFIMFVVYFFFFTVSISLKSFFSSFGVQLTALFFIPKPERSVFPFCVHVKKFGMWKVVKIYPQSTSSVFLLTFCFLLLFFFILKSVVPSPSFYHPPIFQWTSSIFYVIFHSLFYIKKTRKRSCSSFFAPEIAAAAVFYTSTLLFIP